MPKCSIARHERQATCNAREPWQSQNEWDSYIRYTAITADLVWMNGDHFDDGQVVAQSTCFLISGAPGDSAPWRMKFRTHVSQIFLLRELP